MSIWCLLHEKCGIISSVGSTGCIKSWALSETDGKLRNGLQWLDFHTQGLYHPLLYVGKSLQLQWALVCIWMIVCSFKAFKISHIYIRYLFCCACLLSHVWLFATPWTVAHQASLSMVFSKQEILEWVFTSFSRRSYQPRDPTCVSCIGR